MRVRVLGRPSAAASAAAYEESGEGVRPARAHRAPPRRGA